MYKMKFNLPNLPKGAEIQIGGLGTFENGKTYVIKDEQAEAWREFHTEQGAHYDSEGAMVLDPVDPGTILEAFKGHPHITVTTTKSAAGNEPETELQQQEQLPLDDQDTEGGDN